MPWPMNPPRQLALLAPFPRPQPSLASAPPGNGDLPPTPAPPTRFPFAGTAAQLQAHPSRDFAGPLAQAAGINAQQLQEKLQGLEVGDEVAGVTPAAYSHDTRSHHFAQVQVRLQKKVAQDFL